MAEGLIYGLLCKNNKLLPIVDLTCQALPDACAKPIYAILQLDGVDFALVASGLGGVFSIDDAELMPAGQPELRYVSAEVEKNNQMLHLFDVAALAREWIT